MCAAVGVRCLRGEERTPARRVAARFSHPGRGLWLAAGGGSNPRVTMTTGGITRLLLSEGERESGCSPRGGGGTTAMRTTPLVGNGGPVNGLPRTSIRLAEQPVYTYVHARPLGIGTATAGGGGGWIHKQLVSRAFNLAPADTARPSIGPRDYTRPRSWFPGKRKRREREKKKRNTGRLFPGISRDRTWWPIFAVSARRYPSPEIRVNAVIDPGAV